ncbi:MAG TPA: sterol desaturase family protein [Candidatus Acidoferrales bacterium]|nr:sterol desaturase family protein [Candidatus Acidoferrales bacterium]
MPSIRLEGIAYWTTVVVVFLAVAIWESLAPCRKLSHPAERRWSRHGILLAISFVLGSVLLRLSPIAVASLAAGNRHGALRWFPLAAACLLTIVALDLVQYAVHWTFHRVPLLWRIHEVHHSDPDFDVSTAARFHPFEVLITQAVAGGAIFVLAAPAGAVLLWEILKMSLNLAEHANASLHPQLETMVRTVLVTPDMHRIHHSEEVAEQSRNLGQIFPWWDRLFGTYVSSPAAGRKLVTGLRGFQNSRSLELGFMLAEPFRMSKERQLAPATSTEYDQASRD